MRLLGIMGRAGSGKDTVADVLAQVGPSPMVRFAFADLLKREAADAFGVDRRVFHSRVLKEQPLEQLALDRCTVREFVAGNAELAHFIGLKPRTVMIAWGDWRRALAPHYFIRPAVRALAAAIDASAEMMVVTDVRFANEAEWITACGGQLWRVERPGLPAVNTHESEYRTAAIPSDATIVNAGSLDDLRRTVVDLATALFEGPRT